MSSAHPSPRTLPRRNPALVEHSRVRLTAALPTHHLRAGTTGTIVHVYEGNEGFEVEFEASSAMPKIVTVRPDDVEPLTI